jgi:hypothetical protein
MVENKKQTLLQRIKAWWTGLSLLHIVSFALLLLGEVALVTEWSYFHILIEPNHFSGNPLIKNISSLNQFIPLASIVLSLCIGLAIAYFTKTFVCKCVFLKIAFFTILFFLFLSHPTLGVALAFPILVLCLYVHLKQIAIFLALFSLILIPLNIHKDCKCFEAGMLGCCDEVITTISWANIPLAEMR